MHQGSQCKTQGCKTQRQRKTDGVLSQCGHETPPGGQHHARRSHAHAVQRRGDHGQVRKGLKGEDDGQHQEAWKEQQTTERGKGAAGAKVFAAKHDRQVHHIGAGQGLGQRPFLGKFRQAHPLLAVHNFALHHGQHAAKALQAQPGEGQKQIGAGAGRVWNFQASHGLSNCTPVL